MRIDSSNRSMQFQAMAQVNAFDLRIAHPMHAHGTPQYWIQLHACRSHQRFMWSPDNLMTKILSSCQSSVPSPAQLVVSHYPSPRPSAPPRTHRTTRHLQVSQRIWVIDASTTPNRVPMHPTHVSAMHGTHPPFCPTRVLRHRSSRSRASRRGGQPDAQVEGRGSGGATALHARYNSSA